MKHPEVGNIYCKKSSTQVKSKAGSTTYVYVDEDGLVIPIDKKLVESTSAEENKPMTKLQAPQMVRVHRWVSPVVGDFVTVPEDHGTDAQLRSWGYKDKIFQYEAYLTRPEGGNVTTVNCWEMPNCKEFIIILVCLANPGKSRRVATFDRRADSKTDQKRSRTKNRI